MTDEVLFAIEGRAGCIRLNRPKAIHALTHAMCTAMLERLAAWRADPAVEIVLIDHAEGRGFCAGGDIRAIAESGATDGVAARAFFADEYRLNHLLFTYAKPIVAFMDGIVMGGGVGITQPARFRIATERTMFAMPESGIGLFPDVGGGWYLSRLPGRFGEFLALTGARLNGAECVALGIATHYLPSEALDGIKAALIEPGGDIATILEAATTAPPEAPILAQREAIDRLFAAHTSEEILAALADDGSQWAAKQHAIVAAKSPLSCKVALRELSASRPLIDFADEMRMEYGIAAHICQRHDFLEGVRALIVDKDNDPRWDPPTPEGVTDHMIDTIFAPLDPDAAWETLSRLRGRDVADYETLLIERHDAVTLVRLNRPQALNALNGQVLADLIEAFAAYDADPSQRCLVLTGSEKAFAAGADIKEMQPNGFAHNYGTNFFAGWERVTATRKPWIAAVAGFALGGGCEVAMMADFILAADTAKFGQPEIKLGVAPGMGGSQRLTRAVGKAKAMELCLTGRMMGAEEAERAGLVARIVPAAELVDEALKTAAAIAAMAPLATIANKEMVNAAFETGLAQGILFERRLFAGLTATEDKAEGMTAFVEKRPGNWTGR